MSETNLGCNANLDHMLEIDLELVRIQEKYDRVNTHEKKNLTLSLYSGLEKNFGLYRKSLGATHSIFITHLATSLSALT